MAHGRGVSGKRGIGSGAKSHKTSTSKPGSCNIPKTSGNGLGGKAGSKAPSKGRKTKY